MELNPEPEGKDPRQSLRSQGGRDELNLAEFPITLLSARVPKDLKTLVFEDQVYDQKAEVMVTRKLTVTGSDAYGLPTSIDDEILVALIQLTKLANKFTEPKVTFTRYELLRLLGWQDVGKNYRRLEESLNRWIGVTLYYDKAWWDKEAQCWIDANFHILDNVYLVDQDDRRRLKARGQQELAFSSFKWNEVIFKSFQAENLKRLDLDTYFLLESAIAKRMFRFLDKRFYHRRDWSFDLKEFAFEHIGISRNYDVGEIKAKLQPGIEELEALGFLEEMGREKRYEKVGRGEWKMTVIRKSFPAKPAKLDLSQPTEIEAALIARGITRSTAAELAGTFPAIQVQARIEAFDWLIERKDKRVSKSPAGYLADSIRKGYAAPKGFESIAERQKRKAAEAEKTRQAEEAKRREESVQKAKEEAEQARIDAYWDSLPPAEQASLKDEALSKANGFVHGLYRKNKNNPAAAERYLKIILATHITGILDSEPKAQANG